MNANVQAVCRVFDLEAAVADARAASDVNAAAYRNGIDYAELRHRTIMRALASCYEKALADPQVRIPAALGVMLEAVRQTVKSYPPVDV